jgi:hypothetical protein
MSTIIMDVTPCTLVEFIDVSEEHIITYSGSKSKQGKEQARNKQRTCLLLVICLAYFFTLQIQAT